MGIVRRCETLGFQSTHPRGVRLEPLQIGAVDVVISIHAPTWGATGLQMGTSVTHLISIHAPTWGATSGMDQVPDDLIFQSTHPRGVRLV